MKQFAVLMKCPDIRYDVDSAGQECRDMKTAHHGLGIREDDFDAFVGDVVTTLMQSGIAQDDIDALGPAFSAVEYDITTNSAPGSARSICDGGGGG